MTYVKPYATDVTQEELKQTRTRMRRWLAVTEICVVAMFTPVIGRPQAECFLQHFASAGPDLARAVPPQSIR